MVDDRYGLRLSQARSKGHLGANPQPKDWLSKANSFWELSPSMAGRGGQGMGGGQSRPFAFLFLSEDLIRSIVSLSHN